MVEEYHLQLKVGEKKSREDVQEDGDGQSGRLQYGEMGGCFEVAVESSLLDCYGRIWENLLEIKFME
jgi:hypothetical protein